MIDLRCGDARDVLATLEDASVDSVVTDPPYALTSGKNSTKGFMGATWDHGHVAHDSAFWAEVLRVAKPGAHLVAFGGTRTAHRLACAIEDAGWEIRDSLYLLWCHGQGFPKSLDVSKAIDKMAGAEREVVGDKYYAYADTDRPSRRAPRGRDPRKGERIYGGGDAIGPFLGTHTPLTAPASPEAQQWDGWGTALKPAAEPIVLARKPLAEPTVAANVLAHGTGALHIDACRVPTREIGVPRAHEPRQDREQWRITGGSNGSGATSSAGRWPPNLLLSHVSYAWYTLRNDIPEGAADAIYTYYGINQAVRALRQGVPGDACGDEDATVLQPGVRWAKPQARPQDRMGHHAVPALRQGVRDHAGMAARGAPKILRPGVLRPRKPSHQEAGQSPPPRVAPEDERRGTGQVPDGAVLSMEGRRVPLRRLSPRHGCHALTRGAGSGSGNGRGPLCPGASPGGGAHVGAAPPEERVGASPQRHQGRQPAREPRGQPARGPQHPASSDRAGIARLARESDVAGKRERRLEVATWAIPDGWREYFLPIAVGGPDGCQPAGVRRVPASRGGVGGRRGSDTCYAQDAYTQAYQRTDRPAYADADADADESAPAWTCVDGCPVAELDRQAGPRTSGGYPPEGAQRTHGATYGQPNERGAQRFTSSTGNASRFFPTFAPAPEDAVPFRYEPKASRRDRGDGNTHSTVKPTALMAWLCKLVTPEGGVVLDCFTGSGSTGVACVREGFGFIGIEAEAQYVDIARARIAHEQEQRAGPLFAGVGTAGAAR